MAWELRWHPFRGEWVLFTSHRDDRPWLGTIGADAEPTVPENNALGPGGHRTKGITPDYRGVFTFTNDLPVFSEDAPVPSPGDALYRRPAPRARRRSSATTTIRHARSPTWMTTR